MTGRAEPGTEGPTRGAERFEGVERWSAHPHLARVVQVFAYVVPLLIAVPAGWLVGNLPFAQSGPPVLRWVAMSAVATVVLVVVERFARRLLPLSALLDLSLVFPDRAPSRFAVALRAGSVKQLQTRLAPADDGSIDADSADAAAKILAHVFALHRHDRRTRGHSERVRAFSVIIGEELGLRSDELDKLQWAALLHDVGKLEVPSSILNKNGRPTEGEWSTLAGHPAYGERLIAPLVPWLGEWAGAVTEHHERWDGDGYPRGLRAEEISLAGRIVCVADSFEVMTAARSYKRPLSVAAARTELTRCAGAQFDPTIVRVFLSVSIGRIRRVLSPMAWLGQLPFIPPTAALPAPGAIAATGAMVGGLFLGPAVLPVLDQGSSGASAGVAAEETAASNIGSQQPSASAEADDEDEGTGAGAAGSAPPTTGPGAPAETKGEEPPDEDVVPAGEDDEGTPSTPDEPASDGLVTPVVDGVVTPLVDGVVAPVVDTVVETVITPVVEEVVVPVVETIVETVLPPVVLPVVTP